MNGRAFIVITKHARKRLKERSKYKPRMFEDKANAAFDLGMSAMNAPNGTLKNFLLANEEDKAEKEARIYEGLCWLFSFHHGDYWLVTVKPLPATLD